MLDAAPSLECGIALLIFYPAFSQISCEIKAENAVFVQILRTGAAGNVPALLLFVMLGMQHKECCTYPGTEILLTALCGPCLLF